ncbi:MAG: hypothetical protein MUE96_03575 [Bacteroidia bacterium]|jgi:hypothetical protein|nr:hypothetical protein [Bacteroidia bacterium]
MNLIQFFTGGHRASWRDLEFVQAAFRVCMEALGNSLGSNFILTGCNITEAGGNTTVSEGWVVINGEICYFAGETFTTGLQALKSFGVLQTNGTPQVVYKDTSVKDVYKIRNAVLTNVVSGGNFNYFNARRFNRTDWRIVPANSTTEADRFTADCRSNLNPLQYRKGIDGTLMIRGSFTCAEVATSQLSINVFTLPEQFRPSMSYTVDAISLTTGARVNGSRVVVETSGLVSIVFDSPGSNNHSYALSNNLNVILPL